MILILPGARDLLYHGMRSTFVTRLGGTSITQLFCLLGSATYRAPYLYSPGWTANWRRKRQRRPQQTFQLSPAYAIPPTLPRRDFNVSRVDAGIALRNHRARLLADLGFFAIFLSSSSSKSSDVTGVQHIEISGVMRTRTQEQWNRKPGSRILSACVRRLVLARPRTNTCLQRSSRNDMTILPTSLCLPKTNAGVSRTVGLERMPADSGVRDSYWRGPRRCALSYHSAVASAAGAPALNAPCLLPHAPVFSALYTLRGLSIYATD